jgi:glycosyltransferase involved in cell wall biosynthesis
MKVALVQDWFTVDGGAEKVFKQLHKRFPEADIFSLVDFLSPEDREKILFGKKSKTSFLQHLPFAQKSFRYFLPLFPKAIRSLDLKGYDLIISSSFSVAKGLNKLPGQVHICYCHSPMRYAWDMKNEYVEGHGLNKFGLKPLVNVLMKRLRDWDVRTAKDVDAFVANSRFVADRIRRYYGVSAEVVYPPVAVDDFYIAEKKGDYFFTTARLVPYKRMEAIVQAFAFLPEQKLIMAGDGPEFKKLKKMAGSNVELVGWVPRERLAKYYAEAKATVLAAKEDFGITALESMASGTAVLALRFGGYLETVQEDVSGMFFDHADPDQIADCAGRFLQKENSFSPKEIRNLALQFSPDSFDYKWEAVLRKNLKNQ